MQSTPDPEQTLLVAASDGEIIPRGQYLIRVYPDGTGELAWREGPFTSVTWSPPIRLEVAP